MAKDIVEHFLSRADWVDKENTVDRIIVGDPETDIRSCMVTWMPGFDALREAVKRGVDLVICHEPTFWDHLDRDPSSNLRAAEKLDFERAAMLRDRLRELQDAPALEKTTTDGNSNAGNGKPSHWKPRAKHFRK